MSEQQEPTGGYVGDIEVDLEHPFTEDDHRDVQNQNAVEAKAIEDDHGHRGWPLNEELEDPHFGNYGGGGFHEDYLCIEIPGGPCYVFDKTHGETLEPSERTRYLAHMETAFHLGELYAKRCAIKDLQNDEQASVQEFEHLHDE